jgi:hypothetical protein
MTYADLLCSLRERLKISLQNNDRDVLGRLMTTFGVLVEASYESENRELTVILEDLAYSAQHGVMGVMAKAQDIPSVETIRAAFDESI